MTLNVSCISRENANVPLQILLFVAGISKKFDISHHSTDTWDANELLEEEEGYFLTHQTPAE